MMLHSVLVAALVTVAAASSIPDFVVPGKCARVMNQDNFSLQRYSGRWYQTQIIKNPYLLPSRCIHSNYDFTGNGFRVTTAGTTYSNDDQRQQGNIYPTTDFPTAHMIVDFPGITAAPYEVVETDYDSYSCVYSCIDWNDYKSEFGFVFSRTPEGAAQANERCASVFRRNGVDFSAFRAVPHSSDCYYRF